MKNLSSFLSTAVVGVALGCNPSLENSAECEQYYRESLVKPRRTAFQAALDGDCDTAVDAVLRVQKDYRHFADQCQDKVDIPSLHAETVEGTLTDEEAHVLEDQIKAFSDCLHSLPWWRG